MAIQTLLLAQFDQDTSSISLTFDDTTGKAQQLIIVNTGDRNAITMLVYDPTFTTVVRQWSGTVKSGTTTVNIPQNGTNSITLIFTSKGYWVLPFPYQINAS